MRYLSGPEEFRNRESVTLAVQGTRNLKQLAGAELYLHRVARQRAGHPPGEYEVNMLAMRNVVGSVLYAGGSIRPQDDTLGDVLGELYWTKEIDLGCRFDPASRELSIGAVGARVRSSGGTEVELQGGQSAPVSMGCYTATLTIAQAYRSNGVGAPKYDVEFSLVSDLIIEN